MANKYDIAIVGGGVIGWSSAWHLLHRKPNLNIAVVDPDPSRCISHRGAGGCRAQFSTDVNIALSLVAIKEFETFATDVGADIGYRQHGYLLYTSDEDRATKMQEAATYQRERGVKIDEVSIDNLKRLAPCLRTDDLIYAQIGVQDGYMDGPSVRHGYREAALKLGADEITNKATNIKSDAIETTVGVVQADHVVVATGHWSGVLGLDLPVRPEKHQLFFDSPPNVDPSWPFLIDADTTFHFRPDGDHILICFNDATLCAGDHDADELPTFDESVLDRLLPITEHRAPGLVQRTRLERGRSGYYAVTPDRHPLLGTHNGIVLATGFGGHGVMHSPAAGRLVSEIILDGGTTSADISVLSPDRFASGHLIKETMVF